MNWRRKIAEAWITFVVCSIVLILVVGLSQVIWQSPDRWVWFGILGFLVVTSWAGVEASR